MMKRILLLASLWLALVPIQAEASYAHYRPVTFDHTKVGTTETDFAALVSVTNNDLKTVGNGGFVQNANGYDIVPYVDSACGTKITGFELERYTASTGEVIMWVKVSSLSNGSDTSIYLCYSDASISTFQGTASSAWNSNYLLVSHTPNGSSLTANDSTSNGNNGTLTNTPTAATGQIDGAASFASASTQYIDYGTAIHPAAITYTAWVKATSFPNTYNTVASWAGNGSPDLEAVQLFAKSDGTLALYVAATGGTVFIDSSTDTLSTATWYFLALKYDSVDGLVLWINGGQSAIATANGTIQNSSTTYHMSQGTDLFTSGRSWNGLIDEFTVSNTLRSNNWLTTTYNNQSNPGTFETLGSDVVLSTTGAPQRSLRGLGR